jgi:hypothetical protein
MILRKGESGIRAIKQNDQRKEGATRARGDLGERGTRI